MTKLYARHDYDPKLQVKGMFEVSNIKQAKELNKQGYGIHCLVNDIKAGTSRKDENITKINYWIADIDDGSKEEMMDNINKLILKPSKVVETKRGYHLYFKSINATTTNYRRIQEGLIHILKADKSLKSPSRTLRCPNFYHLKDPNNPFLVKVIGGNNKEYTEEKMLFCYALPIKKVKKIEYKGDKADMLDEQNFERFYHVSSIGKGGRNNDLAKISLWLRDEGFDKQTNLNTLLRVNALISEPLPQYEVKQIMQGKY